MTRPGDRSAGAKPRPRTERPGGAATREQRVSRRPAERSEAGLGGRSEGAFRRPADRSEAGLDGRAPRARRGVRVLFARTAYGSLGGGDRMLLRLLDGLDPDRFAARVLSSARDECCRRAAGIDGVSVDVVPYRGALDRYDEGLLDATAPATVAAAVRLVQFDVEAREPLGWADVVWTDCLRTLLSVAPFALASPTPTIWNVGLGRTGDGTDRWLNALGLVVADHVFIESRAQARRTFTDAQLARHGDQFTVFHKGIDVDRFESRDRGRDSGRRRDTAADVGRSTDADGSVGDRTGGGGSDGSVREAGDGIGNTAGDGSGREAVDGIGDTAGDGSGREAGDDADPGAGDEVGPETRDRSGCYRVGTAARITPRKGLVDLLESVASAGAEYDVHLDVAGEPVDESDRVHYRRLRERATALGIDDDVTFHGWVEAMPAFYAGLDLFVLPSYDEGIPGAVREALASGLPVVATDVGATAEVVRDGETGLLVAPGDPDALADAIRYCVEHPNAADALAESGRTLIREQYSQSTYVDRYEAFLAEVVAE